MVFVTADGYNVCLAMRATPKVSTHKHRLPQPGSGFMHKPLSLVASMSLVRALVVITALVRGVRKLCRAFSAALMILHHSSRSYYESATSSMVTSPALVSCTSGEVAGRMADRGRV